MDLTKQKAQTNEGILKEVERMFDEFAEILEKQVVSSPTENFIVDWKSKFKEFVSLVKRMREAQNCWWNDTEIFVTDEEVNGLRLRMEQLESEVDEYLKKIEI